MQDHEELKDNLDRIKVGQIYKETRQEMDIKQEDLADEQISTATISKIEHAVPSVTTEKILYLGRKLGIDTSTLPTITTEDKISDDMIESELLSAESILYTNPKSALKKLKDLPISKNNPLYVEAKHLEGRCYLSADDPKKACSVLLETIHLVDHQLPHLKNTNITSACYYDLSRAVYYQNKVEEALRYTLKGLEQFVEDGKRYYYKYFLLIGKSIYLEKQNRLKEAYKDIEFLWSQIDQIESQETILLIYEQRSKLLWGMGLHEEAIQCAKKGISSARLNKIFDRALDLWTILGSIYLDLEEVVIAENCFQTALELIPEVSDKYLFVTTFTQLGILYIEKGNLVKAKNYILEGVKVGETTNDVIRFVNALTWLGNCEFLLEDYASAITSYSKAIEITKVHNMIEKEHDLHLKISKCYNKTNDMENYRVSIDRYYEVGLQLEQLNKRRATL